MPVCFVPSDGFFGNHQISQDRNSSSIDWRSLPAPQPTQPTAQNKIIPLPPGGGRRSHSLGDFFAAKKPFVCLQETPKQALCSLLSSVMLDIASNSIVKTSCTISGTSVADTRQW